MNFQDKGRTVAALKVIGEVLSGQQSQEKADLLEALQALGVKQQEVRMPDGTALASISVAKGKTSARVTNSADFLDWVSENHPTEIEHVMTVRVRPAYERAVLEASKRAGQPVDPTGEVVPGVEVGDGDPYLVTRLAPGAHASVLAAISNGSIQPLALPAGDEAGAA